MVVEKGGGSGPLGPPPLDPPLPMYWQVYRHVGLDLTISKFFFGSCNEVDIIRKS